MRCVVWHKYAQRGAEIKENSKQTNSKDKQRSLPQGHQPNPRFLTLSGGGGRTFCSKGGPSNIGTARKIKQSGVDCRAAYTAAAT
jgi:hypothetical protein